MRLIKNFAATAVVASMLIGGVGISATANAATATGAAEVRALLDAELSAKLRQWLIGLGGQNGRWNRAMFRGAIASIRENNEFVGVSDEEFVEILAQEIFDAGEGLGIGPAFAAEAAAEAVPTIDDAVITIIDDGAPVTVTVADDDVTAVGDTPVFDPETTFADEGDDGDNDDLLPVVDDPISAG